MHFYLAQLEAIDAGVDDVLLNIEGYVSECRAANIFALVGGRLYTPAGGILRGITRETVFEIAAREGIDVGETQMTLYDFYCADEVFTCTTAGGIIHIAEIDGRAIGDGRPGPLTTRIRDLCTVTAQAYDGYTAYDAHKGPLLADARRPCVQ